MKKRKIGIVGGMGPLAGLEMARMFYSKMSVDYDSEYYPIILVNDTDIPSRTRAYLFEETSPSERLIEIMEALCDQNVTDILVACNSAHYFLRTYRLNRSTKFWNIIENTSKNILDLELKFYVVLGGEVTVYSGIYNDYLQPQMDLINYGDSLFKEVRFIIDEVKSNRITECTRKAFVSAVEGIVSDKIQTVIILACTELTFFKVDLISHGYRAVDSVEETVLNCLNDNK
ncbi:aspartate/glutamate racemase family protein [Akkermansiaceae bacterium]|nr:aspartate/glutamate racemase family protein [Akkermansiaceae bacterium]